MKSGKHLDSHGLVSFPTTMDDTGEGGMIVFAIWDTIGQPSVPIAGAIYLGSTQGSWRKEEDGEYWACTMDNLSGVFGLGG